MQFRIEHRIGVAAPAAAVWPVLAELERWGEWNPVYPRAAGSLSIGGELRLTERIGGREEEIAPRIVDWVPDSQILWRRKTGGGLVTALRYIELEALSEEGTVFSNGELYEGMFAGRVIRNRRERRDAFAAMGEAVKARAEAAWAALGEEERARVPRNVPPELPDEPPIPQSKFQPPPQLGGGYFRKR
ncbi:MAG TPA: SRPBCC family protein [Caulobacteraceae bacterium]|jgi:hypothetical protein